MPDMVKKTSQLQPVAMTGCGAVLRKSAAIVAQFDQLRHWDGVIR